MRPLVTGGSGFIGSHVVDALIAAGHQPRVFDLRPSQYHDSEVDCAIGDLLDAKVLQRAMKGCDAVIHLAAAADVGEVEHDPVGSEKANASGTVAVLEAAREAGIERVVYCSTIWVYGDLADGVVTEDTALALPRHLYTASKLAGEMYCTSYAELYDVSYTILRFGIPYGPRARPAAVVPRFVEQALAGESLTLAGDGSQSRRFVYVEDLADGVVRALRPEAANRIYNLVGTKSVTIREVAETVQSQVGSVEIVHTPGRNGDFDGAEISAERAKDELGWTATTSFPEGVSRYVRWLKGTGAAESGTEAAPGVTAVPARRPSSVATAATVATALLACAIGILIPALIAARIHPLGEYRLHTVAFIVLVVVGAAFAAPARWGGRLSAPGLVLAGGGVLVLLPWTRHLLELAPPGVAGLLFASLGAVMALAIAFASRRLLAGTRAAPETAI